MQKLTASTFKQLKDEAERGSMQAQYMLGGAYINGNGTTRDTKTGIEWLRRAAEQGLIAAQCDLGVMYQKGVGVEQDRQACLKWLKLAATQGDVLAQHGLGIIYAKGFRPKGFGFFDKTAFAYVKATQDFVEAYKWLRVAETNGHQRSWKDLAAVKKDLAVVKKRMSAAQLSKAEQLFQEFTERR